MTIDVIDNYNEIYEFLTGWQLYKIQYAQHKKNTLLEEQEEETQKAREKLIQNGTFVSELFDMENAKLQQKYQAKIDLVQKEIAAYLINTMKPGFVHGFTVPYVVNFALSQYQRYLKVKEYYTKTYPDATERLNAYTKDAFVMEYIKEYYELLHVEFADQV